MATTQQVNIEQQAVSAAPKRNEASTSHFVDQHRVDLIKRVKMVDSILDLLLAEGVITHEGLSNVRSKTTSMEKMREIYELLHASGTKAKEIFYKGLEENEQFLLQDLKQPPPTVQPPHHGPQDSPDPSMTVPLMMSAGPDDPELGVEKELPVGPHEGGGISPAPEDEPPEEPSWLTMLERFSSCWRMRCCAETLLSQLTKCFFMGWGLCFGLVTFGLVLVLFTVGPAFNPGYLSIIHIFFILSAVTCGSGIIAGIVSFKHSWSCKGRSLLAAGIMFLVTSGFLLIPVIYRTPDPGLILFLLLVVVPLIPGVLYICAYRRTGTRARKVLRD